MTQLTHQLLHSYGLSNKWSDVVVTLVRRVSQVVRPDVRHDGDNMDIRNYVQIKKVQMIVGDNIDTLCKICELNLLSCIITSPLRLMYLLSNQAIYTFTPFHNHF